MRRLAALVCLLPSAVMAAAPESSLRPKIRPLVVEIASNPTAAPATAPRPKLRVAPTAERPPKIARSRTSAAVEKVVVEQAITEDIVIRESTAALGRAQLELPGQTEELSPENPSARELAFMQPEGGAHQAPGYEVPAVMSSSPHAVSRSARPKGRPKALQTVLAKPVQKAPRKVEAPRDAKPAKRVKYAKKGSVCGVRGIRGYKVSKVSGKIRGCGIQEPVRVTEIDGVSLGREVLIGCDAARALHSWVQNQAKPVVGKKGGGLKQVVAIAGYSCRTRNSRKGARLSEHAKGNAIDIAGFVLNNGVRMSVLRDYRSGTHASTMQRLHKSACGPFGTVLGPRSDRYHQDHFHFDVARYRSGAYCR